MKHCPLIIPLEILADDAQISAAANLEEIQEAAGRGVQRWDDNGQIQLIF